MKKFIALFSLVVFGILEGFDVRTFNRYLREIGFRELQEIYKKLNLKLSRYDKNI